VSAVIGRTGVAAGTGAGGSSPHPDAFRARLLDQALQPLLNGDRLVVLDLGEPHAETVAFFSGFRVRLAIASLLPSLLRLDAEQDEAALRHHMEILLPDSLAGGAQVVMAWDVLNYLQPPVISALMSRLAELLPRGALVHGFIAYGDKPLAETPRTLVVCPDGQLRRLPVESGATRKAPGYPTGDLHRWMPDFRIERAILLGDGMQECLIRR
jgi:hypothetical protein